MDIVSLMICWRVCSCGLVIGCLFVVVGVYVGSPAMMMSMPSGRAAAMLFGVMSVGASGKRVSHWFMAVSGSCAGYC